MEDSPLPVDEADAAAFASRYLDIARAMITDPSAVTRVEDLITDGVYPEAVRAWQVVSIGPALVSAAVVDMARQSGVPVDDVNFVVETNSDDQDPSEQAAVQSVSTMLNDIDGTGEAALDLLVGHMRAARDYGGPDEEQRALVEVTGFHLLMLASLMASGALADID